MFFKEWLVSEQTNAFSKCVKFWINLTHNKKRLFTINLMYTFNAMWKKYTQIKTSGNLFQFIILAKLCSNLSKRGAKELPIKRARENAERIRSYAEIVLICIVQYHFYPRNITSNVQLTESSKKRLKRWWSIVFQNQ